MSSGAIGRPVPAVEAPRLLTGNGGFLADLDPFPRTLHAAIVRSPHPHAHIRAFDASAALDLPGVISVVGPQEVEQGLRPFSVTAPVDIDYRGAATDRVRYVGEPVAVVVATDRYLAEDAAEAVEVDYEPLPAVVTVSEAMREDTVVLHPDNATNVASDRSFAFGDVEGAFSRAAHVVTGMFDFPRYSSTPIETYQVVARWDTEADEVTAWCNFHGPFVLQPVLAGALGLPPNRVRLIVPSDVGGSFGIKSAIYPYVALIALASRHARAAVRWNEDRAEHLLASSAGNDRSMHWEAAVDDDGIVHALRLDLVDNVGAYMRPPEPSTLYRCYGNLTGAYRIDAVDIRARAVMTNTAPTGLNRGFGGQQLYFGLERLMDRIAAELALDPAEVRRRNLIGADAFPYETPTGGRYDSGDYPAAFDLALERAGYERLREEQEEARPEGRLLGIGLATVVDPSGTNLGYVDAATPLEERKSGHPMSGSTEIVTITVDPFGEVTVLLGTTPQGQGHETVARQVVADRLGLNPEQVTARARMDTAATPWTVTSGSYSCRFSPLTTSALVEATDRVAETIRAAAAVQLEVDPHELELAEGQVRSTSNPERSISFRHAAGAVHWDPGSLPEDVEPRLHVEAAFNVPHATAVSDDNRINSSVCYGFVAEVVVVEIDPETLQIRVRELTAVHDCGTVLNPLLLEGQLAGAIAHGLGGALLEEFHYREDGRPTATTFMDYLCPGAGEMAFELRTDHLETPSPHTRLGAKGAAEGDAMAIPVAISNAVNDALRHLGVEVDRLPVHGSVLDGLLADPVRQLGGSARSHARINPQTD